MIKENSPRLEIGTWLLVVSSAVGLAVAVYDYFGDIGIRGTAGAMLVVISSALILGTALIVGFVPRIQRWIGALLVVLLFLGILCTGLSAYFLEAGLLLAAMVLAMTGLLLGVAVAREREPHHSAQHIHASSMR